MPDQEQKTHFGYEQVSWSEKTHKVTEVFHSVAKQYDIMNDLMSFGIHRLWKRFAIELAALHHDQTVLDVASGTGDLSIRISKEVGQNGKVFVTDLNTSMLYQARERLTNSGRVKNIHYIIANAEALPFQENFFDRIIIGFGLRNVTRKSLALKSMFRILKPGGRLIILEFSQPTHSLIKSLYDAYSFSILPLLGKIVVGDSRSYRYLAESIRVHPNQEELKNILNSAGFDHCDYHNLSAGIVAIHRGFKS